MNVTHTPLPWAIRKIEGEIGLRDCFVTAKDVNGFNHDAEILGDDEYREQSYGLTRKLADCEMIVKAVNHYEELVAVVQLLSEELGLMDKYGVASNVLDIADALLAQINS